MVGVDMQDMKKQLESLVKNVPHEVNQVSNR